MRTLAACILCSLFFWTGCHRFAKADRLNSSGDFTHTNNAGVSIGTVCWNSLQDAATNNIQFILLLPETTGIGSGGQTRGNANYDYWNLTLKTNGHQWKIEAHGDMDAGIGSLEILDATAGSEWSVDLRRGRFWQVSEAGVLTPLSNVDGVVAGRIAQQAEESYQRIKALRRNP